MAEPHMTVPVDPPPRVPSVLDPGALLAAAEALGWPVVAVGLVRIRGGEIAWRQAVTLATEAERQRLGAWLEVAVAAASATGGREASHGQ